jgi:tRNA(fMet)-specific endonuclease VapC
MTKYLLDTDSYSHWQRNHPIMLAAMASHDTDVLAITIITVEELWDGWRAYLRKARQPDDLGIGYDRLTGTIRDLVPWNIRSFSAPCVHRFQTLKRMRLNVGSNDLRIAAIALELQAVVVTRNIADFRRVPGLNYENGL